MPATTHRILWITDPWQTLDHPRDTTLRLAEEGLRMGLEQWWCDGRTLSLKSGKVVLEARKILEIDSPRTSESFHLGAPKTLEPKFFTSIHYRTDPPIDLAYLHPLQLLAQGASEGRRTELINPSTVLFQHNEKFEASALGPLMPPSLVSSQWEQLLAFGKKEQRTVLKPLHDAQSHGIELLHWRTTEEIEQAQEKIRLASNGLTQPILLQRFLEAIENGETRLWFLDGNLLATVKKLPLQGDFKVDMDRGSQLVPTRLTARETRIAAKIGHHLKNQKIRLAAVDLIDHYVTDLNFSSPGLITGMERTLGCNLAQPIMKKLYPSRLKVPGRRSKSKS